DLGRHAESLATIAESLALYRAAGLTLQLSGTLVNRGLTLEKLGRQAEAEASFQEALLLAESTGHMFGVVDARLSLRRLAAAQGRIADARARLEAALSGAERYNLKQPICECCDALATLHEQLGDYAQALALHRRFHALERDVLKQSSERHLRAVQARYQ